MCIKNTPRNSFYSFRGGKRNFLTHVVKPVFYFLQNVAYFIISYFSAQITHYFLNDAPKFKHKPSCFEVNIHPISLLRTLHKRSHKPEQNYQKFLKPQSYMVHAYTTQELL
jgi:membrane-associated protease RseP (regulator of RpoE activity)